MEHKELLVLCLMQWGFYPEAQALNEEVLKGHHSLLDTNQARKANERKILLDGFMRCDPSLMYDIPKVEQVIIKEGKCKSQYMCVSYDAFLQNVLIYIQ